MKRGIKDLPTLFRSSAFRKNFKEKLMEVVFFIAACASILAVTLICVFIFQGGWAAVREIGLAEFLGGTKWKPTADNPSFGIFPMIMGSIYVTGGALIIGVPIGILTAVFMARFCPKWLHRWLKPAFELLAGIPSIVYGFFGLMVLVPLVRQFFPGDGNSMFTAFFLLGIMVLPTIISISEAALRAVPESYYEGALALGASHERAVFKTIVPAARSGILAGVVLGIGRVIGETMALIWVCGNQPRLPDSIFDGVRTMTTNIVLEMGYATGLHRQTLIATGAVLFAFILLINALFTVLKRKELKQ
ncbi:phosphate ABC transporter permease subunit PstC [Intestinimonas sp. MSJ-38]|nr:phosphate ABC transporter permease subunit PstC [Intestinimonas sp. MSJ-38]